MIRRREGGKSVKEKNKLNILWTNADILTSLHMVFMYSKNSMLRGWWDEVTVIIWGATAKLAAENEAVRNEIKEARAAGVKFSACLACADLLGVTEQLERQGIELKLWGEPLTQILKDDGKLITI
jgi:hypothetical protein